jgi:histidinol-phosphate aminotransferase
MSLHPRARPILSRLSIPSPIQKYFSGASWEIDLSNNTNPYVEKFADYPNINQHDIKRLYLEKVIGPNFFESSPALTPDHLLLTAGSLEGIDILLRTFCEPNEDTVCIVQPTFSAYEHGALVHNLRVKNIPLFGENFDDFALETIVASSPKMVFVCNPNNPTGTSLRPGLIDALCESIDGFVVVDEAYIEFSNQSSVLASLRHYDNLIIIRTFSKAWGLAGARCGIILASPSIIHSLRYVQQPFSVSIPTQEIVRQRLESPEPIVASWQKIREMRQQMMQELSTCDIVDHVFESDTNFLMIILKDFQSVIERLKEHKIQVLDCSKSFPYSIRVSISMPEQNQKFMEVIRGASGATIRDQ